MINSPYEGAGIGGGEGEKKVANIDPRYYTAWGSLAPVAQSQGWYPSSHNADTTEYRNNYGNQFNQVIDPNSQERNYIAVIGGNRNNIMDVVVKNQKGEVVHKLLEQVRPDQVDAYFKNEIAKRANSIGAGTNIDKPNPDNSFTALR